MENDMSGTFGEKCPHKLEAAWQPLRRPVNGLNLETGYFQEDRCMQQPPINVAGVAADAFRWLGSGGSELAFGVCGCSTCPLSAAKRKESAQWPTHAQPAAATFPAASPH